MHWAINKDKGVEERKNEPTIYRRNYFGLPRVISEQNKEENERKIRLRQKKTAQTIK